MTTQDKIRAAAKKDKDIAAKFVEEFDFFDKQPLESMRLMKMTKNQLIEVIRLLNEKMVISVDYWDGG